MFSSEPALPVLVPAHAEALSGLSSPALSWAMPRIISQSGETSRILAYSPSDRSWNFADSRPSGQIILLPNAVAHDGEVFEVGSVPGGAFPECGMSALLTSRNVTNLGRYCVFACDTLQFVAFEHDSHLREIGRDAFDLCDSLLSIAIPTFVGLLAVNCVRHCASLGTVTFEQPSRLATIQDMAFCECTSLDRLLIPASVTAIHGSALRGSGIRSVEIEEGSFSFRVQNEFLVDFVGRSLISVIGSPESIQIPSSIEELGPYCCYSNTGLRTVEFESDSHLRSVGECAFAYCQALESICIPSSVEFLREGCFFCCDGLQTVAFGTGSRLRLIERKAFWPRRSLGMVSVPASVEVIGE
jgi:hypothetical protein